MKIAIAGSGAMGSRFGYQLHDAGNDVILIDKWADHIKAINENGLTIHRENDTINVKMNAYFPEEVNEVQDLVILFTKAMGLADMLTSIKACLGPNTKVLCLLNGLGNTEVVEEYVDKKDIFVGVTLWTAGLNGPGEVTLVGDGHVELQNIDSTATAAKAGHEIVDVLEKGGLHAEYSENVLFSIWRKACVNGTLNSTCTILDCNIAQFGKLPNSGEMIRHIIEEFSAVAKQFNIELPVEKIAVSIEALYDPSQAGEHYPSMHQDLIQHHRKTEIDYINGYVSRKGIEFGIPTPYNTLITQFVHDKEVLLNVK